MSEYQKKYKDKVQKVIKKIEREQGMEVLHVDVYAYSIPLQQIDVKIRRHTSFNVIESFLLRATTLSLAYEITEETVSKLLGVDSQYIRQTAENLIKANILDADALPNYRMTEVGKKQLIESKRPEDTYHLAGHYDPLTNCWLPPLESSKTALPVHHSNFIGETEVARKERRKQARRLAEALGKEIEKPVLGQIITEANFQVLSEVGQRTHYIFWVYDYNEDAVHSRVWDVQLNRYQDRLSSIIDNEFQGRESQLLEEKRHALNKESERALRMKKQYQEEQQQKQGSIILYRSEEIKPVLNQTMKNVQKYLFIQSPWLNSEVIDDDFQKKLQAIADRGGHTFITWGIAKHQSQESRPPTRGLLEQLKRIRGPKGLAAVHVCYIGNGHEKELIIDDREHWLGSFNFLSYRGDYEPRGESVYVNRNRLAAIKAKENWELSYYKGSIKGLWEGDYLYKLQGVLRLDTIDKKEVSKLILNHIDVLASSEMKRVYRISLLLAKMNILPDVLKKLLQRLTNEGVYSEEVSIMYHEIFSPKEIPANILRLKRKNMLDQLSLDEKSKI